MTYRIRIKRHYYEGTWVAAPGAIWVTDANGRPLIFRRRKDAERWIEEETAGIYILQHGEYAPPEYMIRRAPAGA